MRREARLGYVFLLSHILRLSSAKKILLLNNGDARAGMPVTSHQSLVTKNLIKHFLRMDDTALYTGSTEEA